VESHGLTVDQYRAPRGWHHSDRMPRGGHLVWRLCELPCEYVWTYTMLKPISDMCLLAPSDLVLANVLEDGCYAACGCLVALPRLHDHIDGPCTDREEWTGGNIKGVFMRLTEALSHNDSCHRRYSYEHSLGRKPLGHERAVNRRKVASATSSVCSSHSLRPAMHFLVINLHVYGR